MRASFTKESSEEEQEKGDNEEEEESSNRVWKFRDSVLEIRY
jgi:hypothetical protein